MSTTRCFFGAASPARDGACGRDEGRPIVVVFCVGRASGASAWRISVASASRTLIKSFSRMPSKEIGVDASLSVSARGGNPHMTTKSSNVDAIRAVIRERISSTIVAPPFGSVKSFTAP